MARPVNADAGATRARIQASAVQLFAERGAGHTSIREIAKQAGVSLAMVHHYFGTKDSLYRSCVESMYVELAELRQALTATLKPGNDLEQLFDQTLRACWRFACEHRPALRLVMRQVMDAGEVPEERRQAFLLPFLDIAGALFSVEGEAQVRARVALQSIVFLIVRYALSTPEELAQILGQANPDKTTMTQIEDHLVQLSLALLPLPEPNKGPQNHARRAPR